MRGAVVAGLVVAATATTARADVFPDDSYAALPCRPTIACTADLVPPGVVELELGYIYRRLASGANQSALPFLVKLTLVDRLQVQLGSNGPTTTSPPDEQRYFDDVTLGLKLHAITQTHLVPSVSLSGTLSIPTAAATGYLRTYDVLSTLYITKDIGWLHADLNVGGNAWRVEGAPLWQAWTALAMSVPLPADFGAMLEGYFFTGAAPISARDGGLLAAVSYAARKWLVFDAGPDLGLVRATRDFSLFVGVTIMPLDLFDTDSELAALHHAKAAP